MDTRESAMSSGSVATLSKPDAQAELGKFLRLADALGPGIKMFSTFIDDEWHDLVDQPRAYQEFCESQETAVWEHVPNEFPAVARIEWIPEYESRWGNLPESWFADKSGKVDHAAYSKYLNSHEVVASWDCAPGKK